MLMSLWPRFFGPPCVSVFAVVPEKSHGNNKCDEEEAERQN